jgi:6-phosphogluconate dehydrogenase (decarboxylating)
MQLGMIGLGRMGGNTVQRLLRGGHTCVVFDSESPRVAALSREGATGSQSLEDFTRALEGPRVVWLMLPAGAVDTTLNALSPLLQPGDVIVDGVKSDEPVFEYDCGTWAPTQVEGLAADAGGWREPIGDGRLREPETVRVR